MTETTEKEYAAYSKKVWIIYTLATAALIIILVTLVARDMEEQFFYSLMTAAGAYVLRPSDRYISKLVLKWFGVSLPKKPEPVKAEPEKSDAETPEADKPDTKK